MMNVMIDSLENCAVNQTQAAGLVRLVRNLEEKGFKVRRQSDRYGGLNLIFRASCGAPRKVKFKERRISNDA